jgi:hypothetical protein
MDDYSKEKWVQLYTSAMTELEHSLMAGRILEARTEIENRLEQLREHSGLHESERQGISDALSGLRMLEREEIQYNAEQQRQTAQIALEKLKATEPPKK